MERVSKELGELADSIKGYYSALPTRVIPLSLGAETTGEKRSRVSRMLVFVLATAAVIALPIFFFTIRSPTHRGEMTQAVQSLGEPWPRTVALQEDLSRFKDFENVGPYDPEPLRNLCKHRRKEPGLFIQCIDNDGGIGNLRNSILLCTRYAIEAGADLIAPQIHLRSRINIGNLNGPRVNISEMFDYELFKERLENSCEGIKIYDRQADVPFYHAMRSPSEQIDPLQLEGRSDPFMNSHILRFRPNLRKWIQPRLEGPYSIERPCMVRLKRCLFGWPRWQDTMDVWRQFGQLLRFRPDVYPIAELVLQNMAQWKNESLAGTVILSEGLRFVGQHLRTEADVSTEMKGHPFAEQMTTALVNCKELGVNALYIATGDADEARKAAEMSATNGIEAFSKFHLLDGHPEMIERLSAMTFDQQALVDFLILLRSTRMIGTETSSFSAQLAVSRHATRNDGTFWEDLQDMDLVNSPDGLTVISGSHHGFLRKATWP